MARKFIPDGDQDFAQYARNFSAQLNQDASRFGIEPDDVRAIDAAVNEFLAALTANANRRTRSMATVARKDEARAACERVIRKAAQRIRLNEKVSSADRVLIGVRERPTRLRKRQCPQTAPSLHLLGNGTVIRFGRGAIGGGAHVIHFADELSASSAKPDNAARLELFHDMIAPDEPIPEHPGDRHGGMTFYVRSYTRSPIRVEYPKRDVPMRVIYWARWASATGETGPFSRALQTPIDGTDWSRLALPAPATSNAPALPSATVPEARRIEQAHVQQRLTITSARRELPDRVETIDTLQAESSRMLPDQVNEAA